MEEMFDSYVEQILSKQSELETLLEETESTVEKEIAYEEAKKERNEKQKDSNCTRSLCGNLLYGLWQ